MKRIRIIAIISAIITALAVYIYLSSIKKPVEIARGPVVVAAVQILEGQEIKPEMVVVKNLPVEAITANTATTIDDVVGRVSSVKVEPGEQMLISRYFKAGESNNGLAFAIEKGMRAFTMAVDPVSGVAGLIKPRDNVDILLIISVVTDSPTQPGTQITTVYSKILLQNIKVLATGQIMIPGNDKKDPGTVDTITLSLTPEQAVQLNLATSEGKTRLVLRSPIDTNKPDSKQVVVTDLVDK